MHHRPLSRVLGACAAVCGLWLGACSLFAPSFQKPTLQVVRIQAQGGNFLQQNFLATFRIENPNHRALPVKGLHAELSVGGEVVATGTTQRAFLVPALGDTEFDMTITTHLASGLFQLVKKLDPGSDTIDYELNGAASIDLPFLRDLPFHQNGAIPLRGILATH